MGTLTETSPVFPKVLVWEGLDGSGKSTNLLAVSKILEARGLRTLHVSSPGGITQDTMRLREFMLKSSPLLNPVALANTMLATLTTSAYDIIKEVSAADAVGNPYHYVLLDRWYYTTLAYQGQDCPELSTHIKAVWDSGYNLVSGEMGARLLHNHTVLFFDVDVDVAHSRKTHRDETNNLDTMSLTFYEKARDIYRTLFASHRDTSFHIDANQSQDIVLSKVLSALKVPSV